MAIVKYVTQIANALGIQRPKVAMISATEQVLPKVESTTDAAILAKMGERGQLGNIDIDGPLALDVAIDKEAAEIKKTSLRLLEMRTVWYSRASRPVTCSIKQTRSWQTLAKGLSW